MHFDITARVAVGDNAIVNLMQEDGLTRKEKVMRRLGLVPLVPLG
jgi:hypothetical protein